MFLLTAAVDAGLLRVRADHYLFEAVSLLRHCRRLRWVPLRAFICSTPTTIGAG